MTKQIGKNAKSGPDPVDIHVGARVRMRRTLLGYTQEKLADALDLTFQQVQKYERGTNRISASRLYQIGQILNAPVSYFYDNMEIDTITGSGLSDNEQDTLEPDAVDVMNKKETIDLVRVYYSIEDKKIRKNFYNLLKSTADNFSPGDDSE